MVLVPYLLTKWHSVGDVINMIPASCIPGSYFIWSTWWGPCQKIPTSKWCQTHDRCLAFKHAGQSWHVNRPSPCLKCIGHMVLITKFLYNNLHQFFSNTPATNIFFRIIGISSSVLHWQPVFLYTNWHQFFSITLTTFTFLGHFP